MSLSEQIGLLCASAAGLVALVIWVARRFRTTPEKRERNRRLSLHLHGRLGDAMITEVQNNALYYTYKVRGVQYEASQDISGLRDHLPAEPERLIGMVGMKYLPKNPANSILICEEWSGLREPPRNAAAASANSNGVGH